MGNSHASPPEIKELCGNLLSTPAPSLVKCCTLFQKEMPPVKLKRLSADDLRILKRDAPIIFDYLLKNGTTIRTERNNPHCRTIIRIPTKILTHKYKCVAGPFTEEDVYMFYYHNASSKHVYTKMIGIGEREWLRPGEYSNTVAPREWGSSQKKKRNNSFMICLRTQKRNVKDITNEFVEIEMCADIKDLQIEYKLAESFTQEVL